MATKQENQQLIELLELVQSLNKKVESLEKTINSNNVKTVYKEPPIPEPPKPAQIPKFEIPKME